MKRRHCAYLTMQHPRDFVTDYDISIPPMESLGWRVRTVAWRDPHIDWAEFDAVYICTPWDYPEHAQSFLRVLARIDASPAVLVNDIRLVRWSLQKTYLRDLEARGVDIVPCDWYSHFDPGEVDGFFSCGRDTVVIKPQIGANANDTFVLTDPLGASRRDELARTFRGRPFVVQPFIDSIRTEGELSLFFLGGEFSHAIRKIPKPGDFRTQEEHGSEILAISPPADLALTARRILGLVSPEPVYARADFVRDAGGRYLLMELELIEPSLYLRMDDAAPRRFALAFDRYVRERCRTLRD